MPTRGRSITTIGERHTFLWQHPPPRVGGKHGIAITVKVILYPFFCLFFFLLYLVFYYKLPLPKVKICITIDII